MPKINRDTLTIAAGEIEEIGKRKCQKQRGVLIYCGDYPKRQLASIRANINMLIRIINIYVLRTNMYYTEYILDTLVIKTNQHT